MKIINPYLIDTLINPLTGLADDDEVITYYQQHVPTTELQYKEIIRGVLIEYFETEISESKKQKIKWTLSYYLTTNEIDFKRIFDSNLCPFDLPENAKDFFMWLWEELFPNEDYKMNDLDNCKIVPNIYER